MAKKNIDWGNTGILAMSRLIIALSQTLKTVPGTKES